MGDRQRTTTLDVKKFPCTAPGCTTLVIGESLCERHVGEYSKAYRVCPCGREAVIGLGDRCAKCEVYDDWDYDQDWDGPKLDLTPCPKCGAKWVVFQGGNDAGLVHLPGCEG